jgi:hypothetical protein
VSVRLREKECKKPPEDEVMVICQQIKGVDVIREERLERKKFVEEAKCNKNDEKFVVKQNVKLLKAYKGFLYASLRSNRMSFS